MTLLATNRFPGDGVTTQYEISFSGGYIDKAHVMAAFEDPVTFARTPITLTSAMFVGPYTIDTALGPSPVAPAPLGTNFLLYRDTPKTGPLVDFVNGSRITEANLDKVAQQSVFIGAETSDATQADALADIVNSVGTAVQAAEDATAAADIATAAAVDAANSAATINPANFATAAQGSKADSAVQPAGLTAANIVDATTIGRTILTAANAAAVRVALAFTTFGSNFVQAADSAAARGLLGLGALALKATVATTDIDNGSVTPVKTQLGALPSLVRLNTANGYGSTNTVIRRFTNVVTTQGTDITYVDSATAGASFTINTNGVYAIGYNDQFSSADQIFGLSLNSSNLTTLLQSLPVAEVLQAGNSATVGRPGFVGWCGYLPAGSVVRPHGSTTTSGGNVTMCQFTIQRSA